MSRVSIEEALATSDAFNRREVDAFVQYFHPDLEWYVNPTFPGQEGRVVRGRDGLRHYVQDELDRVWRTFRAEPVEIYDLDDRSLVAMHLIAEGRESGVNVDLTIYDVFHFDEDRLIFRRDSYGNRAAAFASLKPVVSDALEPVWRRG